MKILQNITVTMLYIRNLFIRIKRIFKKILTNKICLKLIKEFSLLYNVSSTPL